MAENISQSEDEDSGMEQEAKRRLLVRLRLEANKARLQTSSTQPEPMPTLMESLLPDSPQENSDNAPKLTRFQQLMSQMAQTKQLPTDLQPINPAAFLKGKNPPD